MDPSAIVEYIVEVRTQMKLEAEAVAPGNIARLEGTKPRSFVLQGMDDMLPLLIALMLKSDLKKPFWLLRMADDYLTKEQKEGSEGSALMMFEMAAMAACEEGAVVGVVPNSWLG